MLFYDCALFLVWLLSNFMLYYLEVYGIVGNIIVIFIYFLYTGIFVYLLDRLFICNLSINRDKPGNSHRPTSNLVFSL